MICQLNLSAQLYQVHSAAIRQLSCDVPSQLSSYLKAQLQVVN